MAVDQTITVFRGEGLTLNGVVRRQLEGVPWADCPLEDITGWPLVFTLARAKNAATKLATGVPTVVSGPSGTYQYVIGADALDLAPGTYWYDVWRRTPGREQVLAYGPFVITGDARRPAG